MKIPVKKNNPHAVMPTKGSAKAAAFDLYACVEQDVVLWPGDTVLIDTGLAMAIPEGYFGGIYARSGLAAKHGIRPANCVGVVDADYRGNILVAVHNDSAERFRIRSGDRVAQLIIQPCPEVELEETDFLEETVRGDGGFGSTGVRQ